MDPDSRMAEASRLGNPTSGTNALNKSDESFCIFNVFCVFISLVTILADLTTEILVLAEYCKNRYFYWAATTLLFLLIPNIVINIFSLKWIIIDEIAKGKSRNIKQWITHFCMIGLFERYAKFLYEIFSCKNIESMKSQKVFLQRNDLSLLHFLYSFTGTVPQIILQTYAIVVLPNNHYTKVFSLTASAASVVWACASYIYSITSFQNDNFHWNSVSFKIMWHFGMLLARISGIILFTTIFGIWTVVPLGLHWAAMTLWIVTQKTTFCPNKLEETFYNVVMGFVYCFCYINLREGHTRYRLIMFYALMITQNFGSLFLYILISDLERQKNLWSVLATASIVAGTLIGMSGMVLYYRWFHAKGPISWKSMQDDVELNNKAANSSVNINQNNNTTLNHVRSFKSHKDVILVKNERKQGSSETIPQADIENADKKFLLEHWIARAATPTFISAPISNYSLEASSIEIHTVENTPKVENEQNVTLSKRNTKPKKKVVCSPEKLRIKLSSIENFESSIDEITSSNLNLHKRRGICSLEELKDDLNNIDLDVHKISDNDTDGKKTSSDSIDMDLDLSISDINSSDINTFNENIVQKLCLSALKNIKFGNQEADIENIQRIALDILKEMYSKKEKYQIADKQLLCSKQRDLDTPTETLSVHDYENICAVNIAREAWGLRSWNGYSDIENWLHDGSVFRDKRRDTLTSASSEISSCISQELKNYILSAAPFPKKTPTYCNVYVKYDKTTQDDYIDVEQSGNEETFLARPCMVEGKDSSLLEPILEELDDISEINNLPKNKKMNSESSLVATIDEIRKATVTNSPRNLYHRREHIWDSPQFTSTKKIETNLKRALWKEPSRFDSNNIMKSLTEKENETNLPPETKLISKETDFHMASLSSSNSSFHENFVQPCSSYNSDHKTKQNKIDNLRKYNNNMQDKFQDFSNKDIDFLWKLVSESAPTVPTYSSEDLSTAQTTKTLSMQSLILKDSANSATPLKIDNTKKKKTKPRRKFSILREKFEPKANLVHERSKNHAEMSNVLHVRNYLNIGEINSKNEDKNKKINITADLSIPNISIGMKDKRTVLLKQVLSPPKFNTKLRHSRKL